VVLEPFAHVALDGPGALGELGRDDRFAIGERPIEAEPLTEVERVELERRELVQPKAVGERLRPVGGFDGARW